MGIKSKKSKKGRAIFYEEIAPMLVGTTSNEVIEKFSRTSKDFFDKILRKKLHKKKLKERQFAAIIGFKDEFFVKNLIDKIIEEEKLENFYCKKVTANQNAGIKGRITKFLNREKYLTFGGDCVIFDKDDDTPVLIIECKEYIDMTRLKELIGESRIIKSEVSNSMLKYPNVQFWVFAEVLELTEGWQELLEQSDLKYKIDKIFIARKGKRVDTSFSPEAEKLIEFKNSIKDLLKKYDKERKDV